MCKIYKGATKFATEMATSIKFEILGKLKRVLTKVLRGKNLILVSVERQELYLFRCGKLVKRYKVSTSRRGRGNIEGSGKTPTGIHRIYKKVGKGYPKDTVFVGRRPVGRAGEVNMKDPIVARILWLEGVEDGINRGKDRLGRLVDTKKRYIYIHGTVDEVGKPLSQGCIRMKPEDIVELFDEVEEGDTVVIF